MLNDCQSRAIAIPAGTLGMIVLAEGNGASNSNSIKLQFFVDNKFQKPLLQIR